MPNTGGIHRGSVHDINDPENRGRLRLLVPGVLGDAASTWAEPALPTADETLWAVGDKVWVLFEGEDVNRPVYISRMEVRKGDIAPGAVGSDEIAPGTLNPPPTEAPVASPAIRVTGDMEGLIVITEAIEPSTVLDYYVDGLLHPDLTGTRSTVAYITTRPTGDALVDGQDYNVYVVARNVVGPAAPSPTVVGRLNSSVSPELVIARLNAALANFQQITVGNITIDADGGINIPLANGGTITLPASGANAVIRGATIETDNAVINGILRILGVNNYVEGTLNLAAGTSAPKTAPEASAVYLTTSYTGMRSATDGIAISATKFWAVGDGNIRQWVRGDTEAVHEWELLHPISTEKFESVCIHPNGFLYAMSRPDSGGTNRTLFKYDISGASPSLVLSSTITAANNHSAIGVATNGDILVVGVQGNQSTGAGTLRVRRYDKDALTFISTTTDSINPWASQDGIYGVYHGPADFGVDRLVIGLASFGFNQVYTLVSPESLGVEGANTFVPGALLAGMCWDPTEGRFLTYHIPTGLARPVLTRQSKNKTTATRSITFTYYDSVGTVHETPASPARTISHSKRQWISMVVPALPPTPPADAPNTVRVYVDNKLQATLAPGTTKFYLDGAPAAGAAAPTSNAAPGGFAGVSNPGSIAAETGGFTVNGSSDGKVGTGTFRDSIVQSGDASISIGTANTWASVPITFDTPFDAPPRITTAWGPINGTPGNSAEIRTAYGDVTATGFTLWAWRNAVASVSVSWQATPWTQ